MRKSVAFVLLFAYMSVMGQIRNIVVPPSLKPGSRIALVTPGTSIDSAVVDGAIAKLRERGYEPVVMNHVYGSSHGSNSGSDTERAADIMAAFADPSIDAVMCTRGGYGCVRLLPMLDAEVIRANPKWLIGYSDISALHAYMTTQAGVASIHGPMCKHLVIEEDTLQATVDLFDVLENGLPKKIELEPNRFNHEGSASGMLVGGNLLTVNGLSETPYDVLSLGKEQDVILFFEDVSEAIYAIERVLMRLQLSGALPAVKGIVIGQFTEYRPSRDYESMEEMLHHWLREWGYYDEGAKVPVVFGFPTGHVADNRPMVCGATAELTVTPEGTTFVMRQ